METMLLSALRRRRGRVSNGGSFSELISTLETTFSMVLCLSTNIISGAEWYVESRASRHMATNKSMFFTVEEQDYGKQVELSDDATYLLIMIGSISSFNMPSWEFFELYNVLLSLG
jgi:hypothetical protein